MLLYRNWQPVYAQRWCIMAAAVLGLKLWLFGRWLKNNQRQAETELLPTLGPGTILTLLRGALVGLLAGFLLCPRPQGEWLVWGPALLYTLSSIIDSLDGYLARITGHTTLLGKKLDEEYDGLGILISISLAVQYGQLPLWYQLPALSRPLFIGGIWWRNRQGKPVYALPPSSYRRLAAGFQMGFVSVMLSPLFSPPITTIAAVVFAAPFMAGFIRDWLVVSRRFDPFSCLQDYLLAFLAIQNRPQKR
jgi:CDP-diacylglycerol--glycerol-3-phosphate 3-phosphatidyltransferase